MDPTHKIDFNLNFNYPQKFPKFIQLSDSISLSFLSLEESFKKAQESYLPYYSVTIVESGDNQESFYQIYDTSYLAAHLKNTSSLRDPVTQRTIQKIHYFAIPCFQLDKQNICRPIDLYKDPISFFPIEVSNAIQTLFIDSVNENIFATGTHENKYQVRRTQFIFANLIKQGQVFENLKDIERKKEEIVWLWCSSKGSFRGLVNLAKACLQNAHFFENAKTLLLNQLEHPSMSIDKVTRNAQESNAKCERINLIKQLKTNKRSKGDLN